MRSRAPKKVVWNKTVPDAALKKALHPRHYLADVVIPESKYTEYLPHLVPGKMWRVSAPFVVVQGLPDDIEQPPYPYCVSHDWVPWGAKASHQRGSIAVYLGTTRVEEATNSRRVTVLRHTFMIEGAVYLTRNLSDWEPVV